jgi:Fe-S cluster assembly iron-binding protein IscA
MAIEVSERAVSRIKELAMKRQTPDAFFRIGIRGGGCSGLSYFVDFAETADPKDKIFEFGANEKVKVLGNGDISVAVTVTVDKISKSAETKIVAAGGSIK